jgi:hypothetical protein
VDIDFEKIRRDHALSDVIEREVSPVPESRKICCPFHHESSPSLHVYPDGTWHCFGGGCGKGGDVLDFLAYLYYGQPAKGAVLFLVLDRLGEVGVTPLSEEERERRFQEREAKQQTEEDRKRAAREGFFLYSLRSMRRVEDEHRAIFESWSVGPEWQQRARLGFDGTRLVIPASFRDVTFGIKRRRLPALDALAPDDEPKYINLKYSSMGVYNADLLLTQPSSVIVCEDEKSALAICSNGGIAIATNGGAGFWRSKNARWWLRWLGNIPQLYFWRDADETGVPQWEASKEYQPGDKIVSPFGIDRFLKCKAGGVSAESAPAKRVKANGIIEDGTVKWQVTPNAGLSAALDFRGWFPRVEIVDSGPYKDASDALANGIEWEEVIL